MGPKRRCAPSTRSFRRTAGSQCSEPDDSIAGARVQRHKLWRSRRFRAPYRGLYGAQKVAKTKRPDHTVVIDYLNHLSYDALAAALLGGTALCIVHPIPPCAPLRLPCWKAPGSPQPRTGSASCVTVRMRQQCTHVRHAFCQPVTSRRCHRAEEPAPCEGSNPSWRTYLATSAAINAWPATAGWPSPTIYGLGPPSCRLRAKAGVRSR
jgi:hypothetical protein